MRCVILVALLLAAVASAGPRWNELNGYHFSQYCADFGHSYSGAEYSARKNIFDEKISEIRAHNADNSQTYKKGVNQFTDWTVAEIQAYNTHRVDRFPTPEVKSVFRASQGDSSYPKSIDYRLSTSPRVLTAVKNQGACGGCWGFSATESIESHFAIKTGQLPVLSPQQIVSCTTLMDGCGGGNYFYAWMYVQSSSGLNEEWLYPFTDFFAKNETMKATSKCENITKHFLPNFPWYPKANVTNFTQVNPNDAHSAMAALATRGPVSIAVGASLWMNYEGGIYQNNGSNPANWEIDHAVQLVGYGHDFDTGMNYWIVRNSWGTEWGEDGYIRLARPEKEPCGTYNVFEKVCGTSGLLYLPARPNVKELKKLNG